MTKFCMDSFSKLKPAVPNPQTTEKRRDYFDAAGATDSNRIPFAASFLRDRVSFYWHQHKRRNQEVKALLSWVEFKAFL